MKKLALLLTALTLNFAIPAYAAEEKSNHSAHDAKHSAAQAEVPVSTGDAHVRVNGLFCDFCARALEKVFDKEDTVKAIDVNLNTKILTVNFNEGKTLSDEQITKLVTDAGYNVEDIHRVQ